MSFEREHTKVVFAGVIDENLVPSAKRERLFGHELLSTELESTLIIKHTKNKSIVKTIFR
jgi:hypothetical protein